MQYFDVEKIADETDVHSEFKVLMLYDYLKFRSMVEAEKILVQCGAQTIGLNSRGAMGGINKQPEEMPILSEPNREAYEDYLRCSKKSEIFIKNLRTFIDTYGQYDLAEFEEFQMSNILSTRHSLMTHFRFLMTHFRFSMTYFRFR